jgi:putative flippase GtrA
MIKNFFSFIDRFLFKLPIIGKRLYLRQLSKFVIAGGLVTILDFILYIFLTRVFSFWQTHYLWANFIVLSLAAIVSFYFNKNWVFKDKGKKLLSQYLKFWVIGGVGGMVFYQYLLFVFVESVRVYDILAKAFAAIIVLFFRFVIQKFWVFKN